MSTNGQRFWNRVGWVDIEGYGIPPVGLDFKFEVEKIADVYPSFKVSVLGLSSNNINALTVWNPHDAISISREISVFAGYEDDGITTPICRGFVFNALPTPPPEMWMNFECLMSLKNKIPIPQDLEEPISNGVLQDVVERIEKITGFKVSWFSKNYEIDTPASFTFDMSRDLVIKAFTEKYNLMAIYGDDYTVSFHDRKSWLNTIPDPTRDDIPVINLESGLLMVGNVNIAGAKIRVRLNDRFRLMQWVKLESKLIPSASGMYCVLSKKHVGHLRGKEWYTELDMIRSA